MDVLLEPSLLYIPVEDWQDQNKRDTFLRILLDNLDYIEEFRFLIKWTDEIEACLYTLPCLPPWRQEKVFRNQLIPIIMKKLHSRLNPIPDINIPVDCCFINPILKSYPIKEELFTAFLKMAHYLISNNENFHLCLGVLNCSKKVEFEFYCDCHENRLSPLCIFNPDYWLEHIDIEEKCWPVDAADKLRLERAVHLTAKRDLKGLNRGIQCKFAFSENFMADILYKKADRRALLFNLAKRLILSQPEAIVDSGLCDEPVIAMEGVRRFRISQDTRIHYAYINTNQILFNRYYAEGEHDDGLR